MTNNPAGKDILSRERTALNPHRNRVRHRGLRGSPRHKGPACERGCELSRRRDRRPFLRPSARAPRPTSLTYRAKCDRRASVLVAFRSAIRRRPPATSRSASPGTRRARVRSDGAGAARNSREPKPSEHSDAMISVAARLQNIQRRHHALDRLVIGLVERVTGGGGDDGLEPARRPDRGRRRARIPPRPHGWR